MRVRTAFSFDDEIANLFNGIDVYESAVACCPLLDICYDWELGNMSCYKIECCGARITLFH